jgi:hypothetical protein
MKTPTIISSAGHEKTGDLDSALSLTHANSAEEIIDQLAGLGPLEYDRRRETAAKKLGVKLGALDAEVKNARAARQHKGSRDGGDFLRDVEPWLEPVDGSELLTAIADHVCWHVILPAHAAEAIALFVVYTHAHDAAEHSPILTVESPEKRCGKTTLASLLALLAARPLPVSNISTSAVFRTIEKYAPTLIIDEGDTFLRENEEMRGILNSGHNRSTAFVVRCEGDDHEPRLFTTWCAKAIFLIGSPPDTLRDRSVVVRLRRKKPGETVLRLRNRAEIFHELQSKAARWARDHLDSLRACEPEMPVGLNDRAEDNWRILLAIADEAGGPWRTKAREAARALSSDGTIDDSEMASAGTLILRDTQMVFNGRGATSIGSLELIEGLCELPEAPWSEWRHGRPITGRGLAKLLKPFDIRPRHSRTGSTYERRSFEDAWQRYLDDDDSASSSSLATPAASVTSITNEANQRNIIGLSDARRSPVNSHGLNGVRERISAEGPMFSGFVTHVTLEEAVSDEEYDEIEEGRI